MLIVVQQRVTENACAILLGTTAMASSSCNNRVSSSHSSCHLCLCDGGLCYLEPAVVVVAEAGVATGAVVLAPMELPPCIAVVL